MKPLLTNDDLFALMREKCPPQYKAFILAPDAKFKSFGQFKFNDEDRAGWLVRVIRRHGSKHEFVVCNDAIHGFSIRMRPFGSALAWTPMGAGDTPSLINGTKDIGND